MRALLVLLALLGVSTTAAAAGKRCWVCTAGFPGYELPVYGYPSSSREYTASMSLEACRFVIAAWRRNPRECVVKHCEQQGTCQVNDPSLPRKPEPRSPWCSSNSGCGFASFCIGGRCVQKRDPFDNKCSSDADCGGRFDERRGSCRLGSCQ